MNSRVTCPECGAAIDSRAPSGLCPRCLLSLGEKPRCRSTVSAANDPVEDEESGMIAGRYRLVQKLGEGGFGSVWKAEQLEPVKRFVALKVIKLGMDTCEVIARFEAERQALAMMDHPGIAKVLDAGATARGRPFFVMELVRGEPITVYCRRNNLNVKERLRLFIGVCAAVQHAHQKGVIHRDLKPSNVLVIAGDGALMPKVIDFGFAKATQQELTEKTVFTQYGHFLGTPAYISPEQSDLSGLDIDTRSDIYSLGVLLYELLTGVTPFDTRSLVSGGLENVSRVIREQEPIRPSARLRERSALNDQGNRTKRWIGGRSSPIDHDLDWIAMKCLEKDRRRRYATANGLAMDLERYLDREPVLARPPSLGYRTRKYVRRNRLAVISAGLIFLALAAGAVLSFISYRQAARSAARARQHASQTAASEEARKREYSHSDFVHASYLLDSGKPAMAIAHLVRALRTNPENQVAAIRLLEMLARENWGHRRAVVPLRLARPVFRQSDDSLFVAAFSKIGFTGRGPSVIICSSSSGQPIDSISLEHEPTVLAMSPDRRLLAIGTKGESVSIWDCDSKSIVKRYSHPGASWILSIAWSDSGELIAAASKEGPARVWQVDDGELLSEVNLEGPAILSASIAFDATGERVVFARRSSLCVFSTDGGQPVSGPLEHEAEVLGGAFTYKGEVASWSRDGTVRVWDSEDGTQKHVLRHEKPILSGQISPDRTRLLTGTGTSLLQGGTCYTRLWRLDSGAMIGEPIPHSGDVSCVSFSADGLRAASGSVSGRLGEGSIVLIDALKGEPIAPPLYHPRGAWYLALSENGSLLAVSSRNLESALWEFPRGAMQPITLEHDREVWRSTFALGDGGESVLALTREGGAWRWDARRGERLAGPEMMGKMVVEAFAAAFDDPLNHGFHFRRRIGCAEGTDAVVGPRFAQLLAPQFREGDVYAAAASVDGRILATACRDGYVRLWSLETGQMRFPPVFHGEGSVTAVALDRKSRLLASGGSAGIVKLWDVSGGALVDQKQLYGAPVSVLTFSPDTTALASGADTGQACVCWLEGGRRLRIGETLDHTSRVNHLSFDPTGAVLAGSGRENAVRLWNALTGELLVPPMRHPDVNWYGLFLQWTPRGDWLISSGSHDDSARVWQASTGRLLAKPLEHTAAAEAVALHPGGRSFIFGCEDGSRIWDLNSGEPLTPNMLVNNVRTVNFDAVGERYVIGAGKNVFIWAHPHHDAALSESFLAFAETLGGFRFSREGVLEPVDPGDLDERRRLVLNEIEGAGSVATWMRWLATPPPLRTISPESTLTVVEDVGRLVQEGSSESLMRALQYRPGDPAIMRALGVELETRGVHGSMESAIGAYLRQWTEFVKPDGLDPR